jgi:hypothetical protein
MSRILKRPMFRKGGSTSKGIMTGLVDRKQYAKDGFVTTVGQTASKLTPELEAILEQYTPKTRVPYGAFGLDIATGTPVLEAFKRRYGQFTTADDKREAAIKGGAAKLSIGQALKIPKDTRTTAEKNADALNLKGEERARYIKAATIRTEAGASELQQQGTVVGKSARDKIVANTSFVTEINQNLDKIDQMIEANPSISGLSGSVLRFGNKAISAAENFGMDKIITTPLSSFGVKDKVLDTDIATLNALEDAVAPAYARILFPDAKTITNKMIDIARENIGITGFTGATEVQTRLKEIRRQFDEYIKNQNVLLGEKTVESNIKKFKVIGNKLVEQ